MKITEYPAVVKLTNDNVLIVDGNGGTKKMGVVDAAFELLNKTSAKAHKTIFRGKYLGTSITSEQYAAIANGTFEDLWLGDYWTINGINWRIWDFDYWLNTGDSSFTKHHLVLMPDNSLYNAQMNETNVTTGGYVGSLMYTSNLSNAKTIVQSAFGSHALSHRVLLTNAVSNGKPSGGGWFDSVVDLPTEIMMYGHLHFSPTSDGSTVPYIYTTERQQLALAAISPEFVANRQDYWLRDVVSGAYFAYVSNGGGPSYAGASNSFGVRPPVAVG